jgi:hypothetical protein
VLPSFTRVAAAARGTKAGDLTQLIASGSDVASQLARRPVRLADIVSDFDRVTGVLATHDADLRASIRGLDDVLGSAPQQLGRIDDALPSIRRYSTVAEPALRVAPRPLRETSDALRQVAALVKPAELPAVLRQLHPVTKSLAPLESRLTTLFPLLTSFSQCVSSNIIPTLNKQVPDGKLSTGRPAWQDLLHMAAALTGTSPGFDGNGGTLRISVAEGANAIRADLPGIGPVISSGNIEGVRPRWLGYGVSPPFRPDQPCTQQELPNLAARANPGLPVGLRAVPQPTLTKSQAAKKANLLQLLYGSPADHRKLLRQLLAALPAAARKLALAPGKSSVAHRKPAKPLPSQTLHLPAPGGGGSTLQQATGTVGGAVDRLLGILGLKGGRR